MRRAILTLTLPALLMAGGASEAAAGGLDLRIGGFFPRARDCGVPSSTQADHTLFQDVCELYVPVGRDLEDFDWKSEFAGLYGGIEYSSVLAPNFELGIHVDGYSKTVDTSYRDYERPSGGEIGQSLKFSVVPVGATVRLVPTSRRARFAPYVGAGVDAVFYKYEEEGDFIDFFDDTLPIYDDRFKDSGVAFGVHAVGGLRFAINEDFAVVAEGRYLWAKKDMGDDFAPNESGLVNRIDLSGISATIGVHVRF